jgi:hypothetical protein
MSTFALDIGSSNADVITAINYAIANLGTGVTTSGNVGANVVYVNTTTGQITSNASGTIGYLYGFVNVKYANSATGSSGFTSNCSLANYYGVHNTTDGTISNNPVDYNWFQVTGGFGTTKGLYYQNVGGYQAKFSAASVAPSQYYTPVIDNTAIALLTLANSVVTSNSIQPGAVTNVSIASNTIRGNNIQIGTLTGNLIAANTIVGTSIIAQTVYGNAIIANTLNANTIQANTFQANTINGDSIVAGSITATQLQANLLTVGNIVSIGSTLNDPNAPGYWLNNTTGNVRFGGNVSVGQNLYVSGLINNGNLQANTVTTTTIVNQSVSQGVGSSSSNYYIINAPRTNNNTSSGIYYPYPYALANVTNITPTDTIYVNATYNNFFVTANTATITIFSYLIRDGVKLVQTQNQFNATGGNLTNQTFAVNPSFTYLDNAIFTTTANYSVAWGVLGSPANASSLVTSTTYYGGTVVAQILKK